MGRLVEIGEGYVQVGLPNGRILDEGDQTILSDEQWGLVSPTAIGTVVVDLGATGGLPVGGTAGQVLAKATGSNFDVEWVTP